MFTFGHFSTISNECVHCNIFISQLSILQFFGYFFGLMYWLYFTVLSQCYVEMPIFVSKMYAFHLGFHHRLSESNQMENTENLWVDFFSLPLLLFSLLSKSSSSSFDFVFLSHSMLCLFFEKLFSPNKSICCSSINMRRSG